jgi:hypothetical protein
MRGNQILEQQVGKLLIAGKAEFFQLPGQVPERINVTFLKFGNEWIRLVTTDEQTSVSSIVEDIDLIQYFGDEEFKYPLVPIEQLYPEFQKFIGMKLIDFKELISLKTEYLSFGVSLYFENKLNFIIRNHEYPIDKTEYLFEQTKFIGLRER